MKPISLLTLLLLCMSFAQGQVLHRTVIGATGQSASDGTLSYAYTAGEAVVGTEDGGTLILTKGFHQSGEVEMPGQTLSFTGEPSDHGIALQWVTNREQNSKSFLVERSFDGVHFETIGEVDAAGISEIPTGYDFLASQETAPVRYFRIQQVDQNGHTSYSEVLRINQKITSLHSELYPNPASHTVFLRYETEGAQATLSNATGQQLWNQTLAAGQGLQQIPVSDLPEGVYYLVLKSQNGHRTHKVVISH